MRKGIQPFAFLDIVRDTPPTDKGLDHIAIDLAAELVLTIPSSQLIEMCGTPQLIDELMQDKIDQSDYLSDFDFHNAVSDLFLQLKDPHTLYVKPTCLGAHLALQPFSLTSRIDSISGAQVISIDGLLSRFVNDGLYKGIPLRDLVGADVLKLNGVDALKAIVAFTARFGYISKGNTHPPLFRSRGHLVNFLNCRSLGRVQSGPQLGLPKEIPGPLRLSFDHFSDLHGAA